jgi:very-short-patch-repair endonuclease
MGFAKKDNPLYLGASRKTFSNARNLRSNLTKAEELLWQNLRNRRLKGFKFRRQHPIAGYIADFYCHEARLVIEIDGGIHDLSDYQEHDIGRTIELEKLGIKVIRFKNKEILSDPEKVLNNIILLLEN